MVNVWSFIPHRRILPEDYEKLDPNYNSENESIGNNEKIVNTSDSENNNGIEKQENYVEISKKVSSNEYLVDGTSFDTDKNYIEYKIDDKIYKIREIRDEAKRPWWKFFDEFEYRNTVDEARTHKWYKWFPDGTSNDEKKLLLKLDIFLALYSFVGYWVKYVDSANLNNAYVSGMKESLNMKGNDLINTQTVFTVGQIVLEVPWIFLLPRIPITYGLSLAELCWAAFTIGTYRVKTVRSLQAIRFFVGASEAAYFPCIHFLLGSWYLPHEVGRRGAIFYIGQFLGVLTSGLLQSATFKNLSGNGGLEGWRWMFVVDGGFLLALLYWLLFVFLVHLQNVSLYF